MEQMKPTTGNERYLLEVAGRKLRPVEDRRFDRAMDAALDAVSRYRNALRAMAKT